MENIEKEAPAPQSKPAGNRKTPDTRKLTYLAVIFAVEIMMVFVPYLGLIPTGGGPMLNLCLIPILVAAVCLGKWYGMATSALFGCLSLMKHYLMPGPSSFMFQLPWICILPRIPVGFTAGLVYELSRKFFDKKSAKLKPVPNAAAAITGVMTNTGLVAASVLITIAAGWEQSGLAWAILATFPINFAVELAVCALIVPPLTLGLQRAGVRIG